MKDNSIKIFRWTARALSAVFILFALFMFIGETLSSKSNALTLNSIAQLSVFGIILIGLGIAWKWELTGGIIALTAYTVLAIINPRTLRLSLLLIFPATAVLFIILGIISKKRKEFFDN